MQKIKNVIPVQADITDRDSIRALVGKIEFDRGYINLLINNAGICFNMIPTKLPTDIRELQAALVSLGHRKNSQNQYQSAILYSHCIPVPFTQRKQTQYPSRNHQQLITISSIVGRRRDVHVPRFSYGASKAAAIHLAKSFTNLLNPHQIRSNTICPGLFRSNAFLIPILHHN